MERLREENRELKRRLNRRKEVDLCEGADRKKSKKWHQHRDQIFHYLVENGMEKVHANRVAFVAATRATKEGRSPRLPDDLPDAVKEALHLY